MENLTPSDGSNSHRILFFDFSVRQSSSLPVYMHKMLMKPSIWLYVIIIDICSFFVQKLEHQYILFFLKKTAQNA
jgi:hypothetical protein